MQDSQNLADTAECGALPFGPKGDGQELQWTFKHSPREDTRPGPLRGPDTMILMMMMMMVVVVMMMMMMMVMVMVMVMVVVVARRFPQRDGVACKRGCMQM